MALPTGPDRLAPYANHGDTYVPYRLIEPVYLETPAGDFAAYRFEEFQLLLQMDEDFRKAAEDLERALKSNAQYSLSLKAYEELVDNQHIQLKLCLGDRSRLTEKWKKTEAEKNKQEAKGKGGLFTIVGWSLAGVGFAVSAGLLIGIVAQ